MNISRDQMIAAFFLWRQMAVESPHQFVIDTKALQEDPSLYAAEMADFFIGLIEGRIL